MNENKKQNTELRTRLETEIARQELSTRLARRTTINIIFASIVFCLIIFALAVLSDQELNFSKHLIIKDAQILMNDLYFCLTLYFHSHSTFFSFFYLTGIAFFCLVVFFSASFICDSFIELFVYILLCFANFFYVTEYPLLPVCSLFLICLFPILSYFFSKRNMTIKTRKIK